MTRLLKGALLAVMLAGALWTPVVAQSLNRSVSIIAGRITSYNSVITAGWGIPAIVASGRQTGLIAASASVATYTLGAADGSFEVSANYLPTAGTTYSFNVNLDYTDEGNTARTIALLFNAPGSTALNATLGNATGLIPRDSVSYHFRAKAATVITLSTVGTFTTVTYNVEAVIRRLS